MSATFGEVHYNLEPAPFETALASAQIPAPTRGVERIHVKTRAEEKAPARKPRASPGVEARCEEGASEEGRTQKDGAR